MLVLLTYFLFLHLSSPACVPHCDSSYCSLNICSQCEEGYSYSSSTASCISICSPGTYYNGGSCLSCPESCLTCQSESLCLTCKPGYNDNGYSQCIKCSSGYRFESTNKSCVACSVSNCEECDEYQCLTCMAGKFSFPNYNIFNSSFHCPALSGGCFACLEMCPIGSYPNDINICTYCPNGCASCDNLGSECFSCKENYFLSGSKCNPCGCNNCISAFLSCDTTCPKKFFNSSINVRAFCVPCSDKNCDNCQSNTCSLCSAGYFLNSSKICQKCSASNCEICDGNLCSKCLYGYKLDSLNGKCEGCKDGYVFNSSTSSCQPSIVGSTNTTTDEHSSTSLVIILIIVFSCVILVGMSIYYYKSKQKNRLFLLKASQPNGEESSNQQLQKPVESKISTIKDHNKNPSKTSTNKNGKGPQNTLQDKSGNKIPSKFPLGLKPISEAEEYNDQQPDQGQQNSNQGDQSFQVIHVYRPNDTSFEAEKLEDFPGEEENHAPPIKLAFQIPETLGSESLEQNENIGKNETEIENNEEKPVEKVQEVEIQLEEVFEIQDDIDINGENFVPIELKIEDEV